MNYCEFALWRDGVLADTTITCILTRRTDTFYAITQNQEFQEIDTKND